MPKAPLQLAWLNGEFVDAAEARVSAYDRGFLFGDGVYEVMPVYGGMVFRIEDHLDRLERSLDGVRIANPLPRQRWHELLGDLVQRNGGGRQALYLQVTRGAENGRDHRLPDHAVPTVFAFCTRGIGREPGTPEQPVRVVTAEDMRWSRCDLKTVALLANVLLKQHAADNGADEVLLLRDGVLTEGAVSNVFVARDGRVSTPPAGNFLLAGITRKVVLEILAGQGVPHAEEAVSAAALECADEIWITSTSREIAPVVELDGAPVGDGAPGPLYARVRAAFEKLVSV